MTGAGRFISIVVLFLLAGPPIGSLAFSLLGAVAASIGNQPPGTPGLIFYSGILSIVLSWFVGGIQAMLSGAAMALFEAVTGRLSVLVAMAAALVCGLVLVSEDIPMTGFSGLVLAVHLVSAAICGLIAKAVFARPAPAVR